MSDLSDNKAIVINHDLLIQHSQECKELFLDAISKYNSITVDVSEVNKIDIAGLQLLIALAKEIDINSKTFKFIGELKENFKYSINHITFSNRLMSNGDDLTQFICEML